MGHTIGKHFNSAIDVCQYRAFIEVTEPIPNLLQRGWNVLLHGPKQVSLSIVYIYGKR